VSVQKLDTSYIRGTRNTTGFQVVIDACLGVKVRNSRVVEGDPDKVLDSGLLSSIDEVLALLLFLEEGGPDCYVSNQEIV
jgi:hypothetical protein